MMTSTTPLSGTVVTTYTFDAANRLTDRVVSDGRVYSYTWSARGQLLAEWIQGYPVRTFTYNGAGQLVEATVFTLTTRFTYNGLGDRVAVEVLGHGTTTYTLDLAAGGRILAEETITGTTLYLYGEDCLGEYDEVDGWLYYLSDGGGLVRQGADTGGEVVSAWLFDPDGTVLEGPEGPVSHLVCGGVYDWSTGLIYKDGRYFDPSLGIWLALMPLAVVQSWRRRKKKGWKGPWAIALALFLVGVSGVLAGCVEPPGTPMPESICTEIPVSGSCEVENSYSFGFDLPPVSDPVAGFYRPVSIVWCLKEGVDAARDCVVGSWATGTATYQKPGESEQPFFRALDPSRWNQDFPYDGVDYNGLRTDTSVFQYPAGCPVCPYEYIGFSDDPGVHNPGLFGHGHPPGTKYEFDVEFWTVLYDRSRFTEMTGIDYSLSKYPSVADLNLALQGRVRGPEVGTDAGWNPEPIFTYRQPPGDYHKRWDLKGLYTYTGGTPAP